MTVRIQNKNIRNKLNLVDFIKLLIKVIEYYHQIRKKDYQPQIAIT